MESDSKINNNDDVKAVVIPENNVEILDVEKNRIAKRIEERINTKKVLNASNERLRKIRIEVVLKRYEKGNAFSSAMLAGLGQIHIEGTVKLINCDNESKICEFELDKTFAWGGIYGASTSIEDIERTFADGIAETVTGQKEDPQKKS